MRLPEEPDIPPQINIVPMIDVIFAILTFFIMSTLYLTRSAGLPVNLPKAATAEQQAQQNQIGVTIDPRGQITINRNPIKLQDLASGIQLVRGQQKQPLVIISADERVSHGQVIAVMDRIRSVPGVKMAIATQPPKP